MPIAMRASGHGIFSRAFLPKHIYIGLLCAGSLLGFALSMASFADNPLEGPPSALVARDYIAFVDGAEGEPPAWPAVPDQPAKTLGVPADSSRR
jgi:hypothetical protein